MVVGFSTTDSYARTAVSDDLRVTTNVLITTVIHTSHKIVSQRDNIAREKVISTLSVIMYR